MPKKPVNPTDPEQPNPSSQPVLTVASPAENLVNAESIGEVERLRNDNVRLANIETELRAEVEQLNAKLRSETELRTEAERINAKLRLEIQTLTPPTDPDAALIEEKVRLGLSRDQAKKAIHTQRTFDSARRTNLNGRGQSL